MAKTVVVTQSNYIPWRGYFDMIRQADELVLLDDVQYTRRDWRNRNQVLTRNGPRWLTIPVSDERGQSIDTVRVADPDWAESHIAAIRQHYSHAAAFAAQSGWLFEAMREAAALPLLTEVNQHLLAAIFQRLAIATPTRRSTDLIDRPALNAMGASERLARLCEAVGAERYLSGPAGRNYLDHQPFEQRGIGVIWMDYGGYPDYRQCWPGFEAKVSIIDVLLNCGEAAAALIHR